MPICVEQTLNRERVGYYTQLPPSTRELLFLRTCTKSKLNSLVKRKKKKKKIPNTGYMAVTYRFPGAVRSVWDIIFETDSLVFDRIMCLSVFG